MKYLTFFYCIFVLHVVLVNSKKFSEDSKPEWAKKDIRDFSDADMERLLDQWDVSERVSDILNLE